MKQIRIIAAAVAVSLAGSATAVEVIDYPALLEAVAEVESDNGATSRNVFQITRVHWADVNRIRRWNWHPSSYRDMVETRAIAAEYVLAYWDYYGDWWQRATGQLVTAEVLAKMHRVGYEGLRTRQRRAEDYWRKVRPEYEARKAHNQLKRKGGR